jgi:cytochrome b561
MPVSRGIGPGVRLFHWLTVALLAAAFGLAWSFDALGPGATAGRLVTVHRSVGLTILGVMVLRLAWRAAHPLPSHIGPSWERWLAGGVQAALYAGLLAQPLLGWAASGAQGDSVTYLGLVPLPDLLDPDPDRADQLFTLHKLTGFALLGLVALHVAGALRHAWHRDGVVRRMVTGHPLPSPVRTGKGVTTSS